MSAAPQGEAPRFYVGQTADVYPPAWFVHDRAERHRVVAAFYSSAAMTFGEARCRAHAEELAGTLNDLAAAHDDRRRAQIEAGGA